MNCSVAQSENIQLIMRPILMTAPAARCSQMDSMLQSIHWSNLNIENDLGFALANNAISCWHLYGMTPKVQKKATRIEWLFLFGGPPESRTRHQRIMLTNYGFRRPFRVCGLDCLLSLQPVRTVSTRSL